MATAAHDEAATIFSTRDGVIIRAAVDADWVDAGRICYEAFAALADRHGFPHDFPTVAAAAEPIRWMINHPRIFSIVAEKDGRVIGSNHMDERGTISAIGPITVDPAAQDRHVGRRLMETALERARQTGAPGVRLVQISYHNRSLSLYTKLGMDVKESFAAMHGDPIRERMPGYDVRAATFDDEDACNALCLRVHGHARAGEVHEAIESGDARVVERLGRVSGYTTRINYFFHSVAETNDDMKALISDAEEFGTPGYLVPLTNGDLMRWSLAHGLRIFFVVNLMALGIYQQPNGAYLPSVGY
jgi:predicted N-acetyltransferase YhbS